MNPLFIDIKDFRAKMEELRRKGMDFLRDIIGMDWGEEGLGAIYTLENTTTKETYEVAVRCTNRETPTLPTVYNLWSVAEFYEREIYDFFGIKFDNHPDMRRLFLRSDWVGYPLRKDYDESEAVNPIRMENEIPEDVQRDYEIAEDAEGKAYVGKVNVDEEAELAIKYGVRSIPTLLFFEKGQLVNRMVGVQDKEDIETALY